MKSVVVFLLSILLALGFSLPSPVPAAAYAGYQYAFAFRSDEVKIGVIDPTNPDAPFQLRTLSSSSGMTVSTSLPLSPSGQWLAIQMISYSDVALVM
jgi:hypothetical protein